MKVKGQEVPGHDDLDLCDLRNSLEIWKRGVSNTKDMVAVFDFVIGMIEDKIRFNKLRRERDEWDKAGGAPGYVK